MHHDAYMRTTVTLDDKLAEQLRETAHRLKKPFKIVLNDSIRHGLTGSRPLAKAKPFVVEASDCGLRPGYDETRFHQLLDELESEAAAAKLSRG